MQLRIGLLGAGPLNQIAEAVKPYYQTKNLHQIVMEAKNPLSAMFLFIREMKEIDVLYNMCYGRKTFPFVFIAKKMNKKVINHWIGTDVYNYCNREHRFFLLSRVDKHLVCSRQLQEELFHCGLQAEYLPIIDVRLKRDLEAMPDKHAALVYMPDGKESFYGFSVIDSLIREYSTMPFYIVGNSRKERFPSHNAHVIGRLNAQEMEEAYRNTSVLIRHTVHDGLPLMVMEALAKGREVLFNHPNVYEHVHLIQGYEDAKFKLDEILRNPPRQNIEGHRYVQSTFSKDLFLDMFCSVMKRL